MKWFYADAGRQIGPMEESVLDDLARSGVVRDDTLVWREGMASWQPHAAVRPARPSPSPVSPVSSFPAAAAPAEAQAPMPAASPTASPTASPGAYAVPQGYCVECGRPFPLSEMVTISGAPVCAACKPVHLQRMREGGQALGQVRYAGFWIRFLARLIDGVLLAVVGVIIRLPLALMLGLSPRGAGSIAVLPVAIGLIGVMTLINIGIAVAYEVYFVSTKGATLGKQVLGLKIVRADGGPIPLNLAVGRYFAMWISSITLGIGYIIAGFDPEKRALHDRICETRVIHAR